MSHFAQIDENNVVTRVRVIEQDVVDSGLFGEPSSFVQTSYNTHGGVHTLNGTPLKNLILTKTMETSILHGKKNK